MTEMERIAIESARKLSMYSLPENCVVVQTALREFGELALRHINAMKQRKAVARDRSRDAGREMVAECRQSDVETCEELGTAIRKLMATEIERGEG